MTSAAGIPLPAAGLTERAGRGLIRVVGADRLAWLQGLLTNDIAALAPGRGCYATWLTPQGRLITDLEVLALDDGVLLDLPPGVAPDIARRLDALIFAEDVSLAQEAPDWMHVAVHGTDAASVMARASGMPALAEAAAWPEYAHVAIAASSGARVVRTDRLGIPGLELLVPAAEASTWRSRLQAAGGVDMDAASVEAARIAAGRAEWPADLGPDVIPLEAGLEHRAISFTKGCYVGQEVIVRVLHRGQGRVARRLMRLELPATGAVTPGARLFDADREAGRLTSVAPTADGAALALGYVMRECAETGRRLEALADDGTRVPVQVGLPAA